RRSGVWAALPPGSTANRRGVDGCGEDGGVIHGGGSPLLCRPSRAVGGGRKEEIDPVPRWRAAGVGSASVPRKRLRGDERVEDRRSQDMTTRFLDRLKEIDMFFAG